MKNSSFFALQKPRITLFYTCQAVRLCESRHDAFACKRAYSQTHHTIPQRPLRSHVQKRKTLPLGQKNLKRPLLCWWQYQGDTFRTDPLLARNYRVCQRESSTDAYSSITADAALPRERRWPYILQRHRLGIGSLCSAYVLKACHET